MDSVGHRLNSAMSCEGGPYERKTHRRRLASSMALIMVAVAVRLTRCRSCANSVVVVVVVVVMVIVVVMVVMIVVMVVMVVMVLRYLYFVAFGRLGPLLFRGFQDGWSVRDRLQQLGE